MLKTVALVLQLCYNLLKGGFVMINDISLGKYIEQKRIEAGLSQRELSFGIKISHSTISRIEKDDGIVPDNKTLKALANKLKLDYNYLLALNKSIDNEPEIRIIQRAAKKMSPSDKKKMIDVLKSSFNDLFNDDGNE